MDEDSDREDQPLITVRARVTFAGASQSKKILKVNDGKNELICELTGPIFVEVDDLIVFESRDTRIGKNGAHKGKTIYLIDDPSKIRIKMPEDEYTVERCFMRADYRKGRAAYREFEALAIEEGISVAQYMDENSEELAYTDKFCAWWVKHRLYRRLWHLGLKRADVEEYTENLQCSASELYGILTTAPGPLYTTCVDLGLAISLSKEFKLPYTDDDVYLARIARFIYYCSAKLKHVSVGQKAVTRQFPNIKQWKERLLARYKIMLVGRYYYLSYNYQVEEGLADKLSALLRSPAEPVPVVFKATDTADSTQQKAVTGALNNRLFGIFGPAGSGKTTIVKYIVRNLESRGVKYVLAGPTGPSVVRLCDSMQSIAIAVGRGMKERTMTLHMLLRKKGHVPCEHLIIDEISMVNHALLYEVLKAYPTIKFLTVVGDNNQLQPLKWGNLMGQLLASKVVPHIKLRRDYRAQNPIFQFDQEKRLLSTAFCKLKPGGADDVVSYYETLLKEGISHRDIIIITPTNSMVDELNIRIQEVLARRGGDAPPDYLLDKRGRKFMLGDKVILLKNNYGIEQMNGDIGVIIEVDKTRRIILVEFAGKAEEYSISTSQWGGDYSYHGEGDMMTTDSLSLAHAITTHKSQGAQWALNIFVFPVDNTSYSQAEEFYNFHMIYTALSRTIIRVRVIGNIREFHRSFDRKPEEKIDHLGQKLAARLAQDRIDHLDQELAV